MTEKKPNPLAPTRATVPIGEHPMMGHAKLWQHVQSIPKDELAQKADVAGYAVPILGALAAKPDVKSKDVIKAAAQAAADGKIPPSQAVEFISSMPTDPTKLKGWLKGLYSANLTGLVHMKAAMMQQAQPAAPAAAPAGPAGVPQQ